MISFTDIIQVSDEDLDRSELRRAMLFEIAMARSEIILEKNIEPSEKDCLNIALRRQRRHYDAVMPNRLAEQDLALVRHVSQNLLSMLREIQFLNNGRKIEVSPKIPGLGWVCSGNGDFSIEGTLIEVKNSDRNFVAGDFRQILMYWMLKYCHSIQENSSCWKKCILLNPRKNQMLEIDFDFLSSSASSNLTRVEILELFRSLLEKNIDGM